MTTHPTLNSAPRAKPLHTISAMAAAVLATAVPLASHAAAPGAQERAAIQQTYRAERGACVDGSSRQERSACLAEAGAARQEALRGQLGLQTVAGGTVGRAMGVAADGSSSKSARHSATRATRSKGVVPDEADLLANALTRCDAVPSDVRSDCERRVHGADVIVLGSVAGGGIIRELPASAQPEPALMLAQAGAPSSVPMATRTGRPGADEAMPFSAERQAEAEQSVERSEPTQGRPMAPPQGMAAMTSSPRQTGLPMIVAEPAEPPMEGAPPGAFPGAGQGMGTEATAAEEAAEAAESAADAADAAAAQAADAAAASVEAALLAESEGQDRQALVQAGQDLDLDRDRDRDHATSSQEPSPYPMWMQAQRLE